MDYRLSELKNGVRVVTVPMRARSSAAVAVWVNAGGRFEAKNENGISHFLEHMVFKGTRRRTTRQIKEAVEGVGGMLNAFTAEEHTCYFAKLLAEHYPKAIDVLADMVSHATMDSVELLKERPVILEEIKMYRDLPAHEVHDMMSGLLWPNQPLGRPLAGTVDSVQKISRSQLLNYKKRFYHPKNIVVTVSGPVNHQDVVSRVEDAFPEAASRSRSKFKRAVIRQTKPKTLFIEKNMEQTHLVIGLHGLSRFSRDRYKLSLLNVMLGANMSSRLFEEVREKRGLAYEIKSGLNYFEDTGFLNISAGVENRNVPRAIALVLKELDKLRKKPVKPAELRRAKDFFMSQMYMNLEDTLEHVLWLGERGFDKGPLPNIDKMRRGIEAVTPKGIQDLCRKLFTSRNLNLSLIGPLPPKIQSRIENAFYLEG